MNDYDLGRNEDFLEFVGFSTQDNVVSPQLHVKPQTQVNASVSAGFHVNPQTETHVREGGVYREVGEIWDDCVDGETSEDVYGSDDSFEWNNDLSREELRYDDEEMYEWRATNRNLRSTQMSRTWPLDDESTFHENPLESQQDRDNVNGSSSKWPSYFTTYEGGYESDQRPSDDEGGRLSDDNSDSDLPLLKKRKGIAYPMFNEKADMRKVEFESGLRFVSREVFKEAILVYSIQQHKDLIYMKNDKKHIHLGCSLCKWELTAGPEIEDASAWQIKSMQPIHNCLRTMNNRLITEAWLVREYLDKILRNPLLSPAQIRDDMKDKYQIVTNIRKCQRAKEKALNAVTTLMQKQYGILKPYLLELVKSNPGTTCVLKTLNGESEQPKIFQRFYVCFSALRKSFVETCRPIFGLDGCFLKHACGGQLLCAVGRDGNNHMFPIAWAIVERENQSSWMWFCKLLSEDLKMQNGEGWTVVSDQQKGLIDAIASLWPQAEHRNCARHIYSNWSKQHKGKVLEKQFWRCVKATSKGEYDSELKQLKEISQKAFDDFEKRNPEHFCKSFFKTHSCCDVVDNNMAETFNSFILLSRYKPIVSMLEDIRMAIMDRMMKKKKLVSQFVAGVAPRISLILEAAYSQQSHCECKWNGEDSQTGFEVVHNGVSHAVDIGKKSCSCRAWNLTGIPCCHAMSALLYMGHQPEKYLPKWYLLQTYNQTYSSLLQPVPGSKFWDHEEEGMVLPPDIVKSKCGGRRKIARRKDVDEVPKSQRKYSRLGKSTKCSRCGEQGHDKRKCTLPANSTQTQIRDNLVSRPTTSWNRGRKRGGKNRLGRIQGEVSTPAEYIKTIRGHKGARRAEDGAATSSSQPSWLQAVASRRGAGRMGRGRGVMAHRRSTELPGIGVYFGERGEVIYRSSMIAPNIVINGSQMPHSSSPSSTLQR